jgi:hypothetical protein
MSVDTKRARELADNLSANSPILSELVIALADEVERLEVRLDAAAFEQAEIWRNEREEVSKQLLEAAEKVLDAGIPSRVAVPLRDAIAKAREDS